MMAVPAITCGCGGIGRRAALRSLWDKTRGSSSLLSRTIQFSQPQRIPCVPPADWPGGIQMVIHLTKVTAPYLIRKRGIFYLHKRIPKDLVGHYGMNFIRKSLKTRDRVVAIRLSSSIVASLEKEWMDIRFNIPDEVSTFEFLKGERNTEPLLSVACQNYLQMKGRLDDKRFHRHTTRVVGEVIELAGDKLLSAYSRADAVAFRDKLLARRVSSATVKRNFECIRAVWNYSAREYGLNINNPFANMNYGTGAEPVKRKPVPIESIRIVQNECMKADDEIRWLIALISDTGMRLAEAAGLHKDDVHLDGEMPFISLVEHDWRPLKTRGSKRDIPLVGAALWAVKRASEACHTGFLFPRYCSEAGCKADYASNTLNKWMKPFVPEGCVIHSFRHSLRDRLRAVECPSDIIDQIGGWATTSVGQGYGEGYPLKNLYQWMQHLG